MTISTIPVLESPIYELEIPSNGNKVKYRPFLVKEHKVLMTMIDADSDEISRIVKELITACTFGKLNVDDLPHFDVTYIFLQIRAKSIGEVVDVVIKCDCGNEIETSFDLEKVEIRKSDNHTNKIRLNEKYWIELKYPNIKDTLSVYNNNSIEDKINIIVNSIKSIYTTDGQYWNSEDQSKESLVQFVESMTNRNLEMIEEFFKTEPKIIQEFNVKCPKCEKDNYAKLEGIGIFFV